MRIILFIIVLGLLSITSFQLWMTQDSGMPTQVVDQAMGKGEASIGASFTLTDQQGKSVDDLQFRGKLMLVFFGFTHCPDVCPLAVSNLSKMMALLGEKADKVAPIFITVDPKRDTPDVMKDYLSNFDARIVGLTGSEQAIESVLKGYKAYAARAETSGTADDGKDYMMDHSGYIYLMDKTGAYQKIFSSATTDQELAKAVEHALE